MFDLVTIPSSESVTVSAPPKLAWAAIETPLVRTCVATRFVPVPSPSSAVVSLPPVTVRSSTVTEALDSAYTPRSKSPLIVARRSVPANAATALAFVAAGWSTSCTS